MARWTEHERDLVAMALAKMDGADTSAQEVRMHYQSRANAALEAIVSCGWGATADPAPDTVDGAVECVARVLARESGVLPDEELIPVEMDTAREVVAALAQHGWGDVTDLRAHLATLTAERDNAVAELERWRSGQRVKGLRQVEQVPDGIQYAARLARSIGTEGGEEHDTLLANAAQRMKALADAGRDLLAEAVVLRAELAERTRERDDARDVYAKLGNDYDRIAGEWVVATRQRDALRVTVASLEGLLLDVQRDCVAAVKERDRRSEVVEAAVAWLAGEAQDGYQDVVWDYQRALRAAVERYQQHPAVTDSPDSARVGICGAMEETLLGDDYRSVVGPCDLPAGHVGWHGCDQLPPDGAMGAPTRVSWTEGSPFLVGPTSGAPRHHYLSTACYHGRHAYCAGTTRLDGGAKTPGQCKFCGAPCQCEECDHSTPAGPLSASEPAEQPDTGAQGADAVQDRTGHPVAMTDLTDAEKAAYAVAAGLDDQDRTGALKAAIVAARSAFIPAGRDWVAAHRGYGNSFAIDDRLSHAIADAAVRAAAPHIQREALEHAADRIDALADQDDGYGPYYYVACLLREWAGSLIPDPAGSQDETGEGE